MESINLGIILIFGIGILGGVLGAHIFQKLKIPQVIGYITIGIILGEPGLHLIKHEDILALRSFNWIALGVIGFLIGGELNFDLFKKYGKQFFTILFSEGLLSFFLVALPIFFIILRISGSFHIALASGIVFGAIASATDPASTVEVLWEYRAKGPVTTALIAIVALDDALAMILYGLGTGVAQILTGASESFGMEIWNISRELLGSLLMGLLCALLFNLIIRYLGHNKEKMLAITLGLLLLVIGISQIIALDVILVTMSMGITLINIAPKRSRELFSLIKNFSPPIYVMFFVLVGSRLNISNMPVWLWGIVLFYVLGRSIGKTAGSFMGAHISKAEPNVRKYTGLGLFAQGGVAIGLGIMASIHLKDVNVTDTMSLGDMIIFGVTATTFIVQIIGPLLVKLAIKKSGEMSKNLTEEDVISSLKISDVIEKDIIFINENEPLSNIFKLFSDNDFLTYPVINNTNTIIGMITLEQLKDIVTSSECWKWLVAKDVVSPIKEKISLSMSLREALDFMIETDIEQLPIVTDDKTSKPVGILDIRTARKKIKQILIQKQQCT
ncbi:MAG: cation:proton antiporter [bacterium]